MFLYKLVRALFIVPVYKLFYPTKIINKENFKKGKYIYICNHYTSKDGFILSANLFPDYFHALVKKEAFKGKLYSAFLRKGGLISVDRDNVDLQSFKNVLNVLNNNESIVIFPEGHRNKKKSEELTPIKGGAAVFAIKSKTPIIPLLYYKAPGFLRKNYLIVGREISFDEYYGKRITKDVKDQSSQDIENSLNDLRKEINALVVKGDKQ